MSVNLTRRGFFKLIAAAVAAKAIAAPGLVELTRIVASTEDEAIQHVERWGKYDFFVRSCYFQTVMRDVLDLRIELTNGPVTVTAQCCSVTEDQTKTLYRGYLEMRKVYLDWHNSKRMFIEGVPIDVLCVDEAYATIDTTSLADIARTFLRAG